MSADEAVVLLRVPEWDAPEEIDVRFLDDGALVFLPLPFDSDPHELLQELVGELGDVVDGHDDERGVFFFPDSAEPNDAESYEAVIEAVGSAGRWIGLDAPEDMMGKVFEMMGISDPNAFMQAMQSGDPDAMKLAQIQMQGRLEEAMRAARGDDGATHESEATTKSDSTDEKNAPKK
jgi:hypothetical protein